MGVITSHKKFQESIGHYADFLKTIKAGNLDTTLYIYDGNTKTGRSSAEKKVAAKKFHSAKKETE